MPSAMGKSAETIKTMTDANAAAKLFMDLYERPGKPNWDRRVSETNRALRMGISKGTVTNDRGPITRIDDVNAKPKVDNSALNQAKEFFNKLAPQTVGNFGEDALVKARDYFNKLLPTETKQSEPTLFSPKELKPL
jgi:hypothetical protein